MDHVDSMANLNTLASELSLLILGDLPQNSLAALSIASKQLRPLVEPLLYRSVKWTFRQKSIPVYRYDIPNPRFHDEDMEGSEEEEQEDDRHRFILFIRSIAERPTLGSHVVRLRMELQSEDEPRSQLFETTDENRQILLREINRMRCPRAELYDGILQGKLDAATCILLSLLPNLRKLDIEYGLAYSWELLSYMILWLASPVASGRNLPSVAWKEVSMVNWNLYESDSVGLADSIGPMRSLFYMPSLETIEIVLSDSDSLSRILSAPQATGIMPNLPNLTTLRLLQSEVRIATLDFIISRTPNLKVLEYNFVQDMNPEHRLRVADEWWRLTEALTQVSSTLREFIMSVSYHYREDYMAPDNDMDLAHRVWQRRGDMGSLKSLVKLQRLEIPIAVLLGYFSSIPSDTLATVLPGGLRELCLRDDLVNMWIESRYEWTPWVCNVIGERLNYSFRETCDPSPLLSQLKDYLDQHCHHVSGKGQSCLQTLVLKQSMERQWPISWRKRFHDLFPGPTVVGKFHVQLPNDKVKEISRDYEAVQEDFTYFEGHPKALTHCYL